MPDRQTLLTAAGSGALALLSSTRKSMAQQNQDQNQNDQGGFKTPNDPFILFLNGIYQPVPVGQGPADNLGLSIANVDLNDGTFYVTKIYPVFGIANAGGAIDQHDPIGKFYASLADMKCAYDLPGGAITMQFDMPPAGAPPGYNEFNPTPYSDGKGGFYIDNTWELEILEAIGVYQPFTGGHNHMVDHLHQLVAGNLAELINEGQIDEFCFCNISTYKFNPPQPAV